MKNLVVVLCLVSTVVLVQACSGGYCATAANTSFKAKWGSCDAGAGVTLSDSTCKNVAACQKAYDTCPAADQKVLNTQLNCITNAATCTPGGETAWMTAFLGCASDAGSISTTCSSALSSAAADGGCN